MSQLDVDSNSFVGYESSPLLQDYLIQFREHFLRRNWHEKIEDQTGTIYFTKKDLGSLSSLPDFMRLSKKSGYLDKGSLISHTDAFFGDRYEARPAIPIMGSMGTIFTVAGVQHLSGVLVDEEPVPDCPFFTAQPSIRLNAIDGIEKKSGVSSSFVNLTTLEVNGSLNNHFESIDVWLDYLSSLGLFVGDVTLVLKIDSPDWGKGTFKNIRIDVMYGDMQLGDAVYIYDFPQDTRPPLTVSDIGFGLERIAWALNKTPNYFDWIGPMRMSIHQKQQLIDAVRTMTLIAGSGITPANKGQGYRFRQLSKSTINGGDFIPTEELIRYYHQFWKHFYPEMKSAGDCVFEICRESNRNRTLAIIGETDGDFSIAEKNPDDLLEEMLKRRVEFEKIVDLIK